MKDSTILLLVGAGVLALYLYENSKPALTDPAPLTIGGIPLWPGWISPQMNTVDYFDAVNPQTKGSDGYMHDATGKLVLYAGQPMTAELRF